MTWDCVHHQQFISHRYVESLSLLCSATYWITRHHASSVAREGNFVEFYELQCVFSQRIIAFNDAFGRVKTDELIPIRIDATAAFIVTYPVVFRRPISGRSIYWTCPPLTSMAIGIPIRWAFCVCDRGRTVLAMENHAYNVIFFPSSLLWRILPVSRFIIKC